MYNLKNSLKFKLFAFWRNQTLFIDQKCTDENVPKNLARVLLPPHLDKIQNNSSFFGKPSLMKESDVAVLYESAQACVWLSASP